MIVTCKCGRSFDVPNSEVVKAHARLVANQRELNGTKLTSEQATANQILSTAARLRNKNQGQQPATEQGE